MQKRLVFIENWPDPIAEEILGRQKDIDLTRISLSDSDEINWGALSAAHAYQVRAARDELPLQFHVTAHLLQRCPDLLVCSSSGAGYDPIDVDACTQAGVIVVNQAGGNAEAVAEHTLALMLSLSKKIGEADRFMRREPAKVREKFKGSNVKEKTIGLIGIGNVGRRVAQLCSVLFGMRVLAYDPYVSDEEVRARGGWPVGLDELLAESDFVSVHCPRTRESKGMFDAAAFAKMKPGAYFITTARGGIHDEMALHAAMVSGRIAGAGLDVWDPEPPAPTHPLLQLDNVIASPHTAGVTSESRRDMAIFASEQLIDILNGERPPRLINPEAWPAYCKRFEAVFGFQPKS